MNVSVMFESRYVMPKTILITGATDGIGAITAEKLVRANHNVIIHGRNSNKLQATESKLSTLNMGLVDSYIADLSDLKQVEKLATMIMEKYSHIDVLLNNAGVYKTNSPIAKTGLDVRFIVNTLAPYLLTRRLSSIMDTSGRVVNLSSAAQAPVELNALRGEKKLEDPFSAYAQSKLAITMWTKELAKTLDENAPILMAINPGSLLASKMVKEGFGMAGNDINIGADILIKACLSDEFSMANGKYFDNDIGQFSDPHPAGIDEKRCKELVEEIERLL